MRWLIRLLVVLAVPVAAMKGAVRIGGPVVSGGYWLTAQATTSSPPETPRWPQPYHRGEIDFATGLYVRTDQDLMARGDGLPIVLKRTYRNQDSVSRAFGVGATHNGEWYLRGDGDQFQWAELVLDDGERIRYERTSWGTSFFNAVYEHLTSPGVFRGSRIGWTGTQWALRWLDGSVGLFQPCGPGLAESCSIVELRDAWGRSVSFVREGPSRRLRAMRSGSPEVLFDYDDHERVVRARSGKQEIRYSYDEGGRLARVEESEGVVRRYSYDAEGAMLTVDEPKWHIENTFDAGGRCVHHVTRWPDGSEAILDVRYVVKDKVITKTAATWAGEPTTVYHFNLNHYLELEERDPGGPAPIVIRYNRKVASNIATDVTVQCLGPGGRIRQAVTAPYLGEDATDALVNQTCTPREVPSPTPHRPPMSGHDAGAV